MLFIMLLTKYTPLLSFILINMFDKNYGL